jgi:hypothetical protein
MLLSFNSIRAAWVCLDIVVERILLFLKRWWNVCYGAHARTQFCDNGMLSSHMRAGTRKVSDPVNLYSQCKSIERKPLCTTQKASSLLPCPVSRVTDLHLQLFLDTLRGIFFCFWISVTVHLVRQCRTGWTIPLVCDRRFLRSSIPLDMCVVIHQHVLTLACVSLGLIMHVWCQTVILHFTRFWYISNLTTCYGKPSPGFQSWFLFSVHVAA